MAFAASLPAQSIIPAKAGLVSYADDASIEDRLISVSPSDFFFVKEDAVLRTGAGRAEVLLGPCAAMWIDEKSSFRMISSGLSDIRIEVLSLSSQQTVRVQEPASPVMQNNPDNLKGVPGLGAIPAPVFLNFRQCRAFRARGVGWRLGRYRRDTFLACERHK